MPQEYDIVIDVDPPYAGEVEVGALAVIARQVLVDEQVAGPLDVGIWITNADELHTLNRRYRNVDRTTDVLSFGDAADEPLMPFFQTPEEPRHLGDLAISYEHVVQQAAEYDHSRERELAYLLTHGLLHLLGYDHEAPEDALTMRQHEEMHLQALGITRHAAGQ
ncbi:MAG: rRNA maturation RNase YbeY [Herpetosiphonaceae bacterium]|nr:rRNA maturation RNase YbeY [Herpetosiphonaceae bacterium]